MNIFEGIFGGLADSKFSGLKGSFYRLVGLDFHSVPGIIKVRQKLTKDSGATVDALCKVSIAASDGSTLWFSSTSGKIWRRTSAGVWSLVHTTTPVAGGAGCLGAVEHDGFIYWGTENKLHRKTITDLSDWSGGVTEDWATFTNTDADFHPMVKQGTSVFIGDAHYIAKVSGATGAHAFTANALNLRTPHRVKCLIAFGIDLLIGTFIHANVNKADIIRWDTESTSWTSIDQVDENGINAFIRDDNYVYAQAGQFGRIYYYNGQLLVPYKRIPGDWSPTKTAEIHPNAVATLRGVPIFGLSNVAGNPCLQGVYSFGSYDKNYQKVLDLSFPISADLSDIEIGCILSVGADLFVSWKDVGSSAYGIDKLDYSNKYQNAYIETGMLTPLQARSILKSISKIIIDYAKILPASCGMVVKYKKKYDVAYGSAMTIINDTKLVQSRVEESLPEIAALQLKFEFTVNSNNAPEIEKISFLDNIK